HYEGRSSEHQVGKGWPLAPHCGRSAPQKGPLGFAICTVQKEYKRHVKKIEKISKKCLTALWRSYIIALASRGIRNAETRYTTEAVKLFAGVVQW
ncbi:hypothetical protein ACTQ41_09815, partial [Bacillota bacterium LCP21S3_D8]